MANCEQVPGVAGDVASPQLPIVPQETQQGVRKAHERVRILVRAYKSHLGCRCGWETAGFYGDSGYESANVEFDNHVDDEARIQHALDYRRPFSCSCHRCHERYLAEGHVWGRVSE